MTAIVGRLRELDEIERALSEARGGRGRLLLVSGPAGIGKSRLAEFAVDAARDLGMTVAAGYAVDDPGAPALWPWQRMMRDWTDAEALPYAAAGEHDAAARFGLFVAIADLVRRRATGAGMLLVLEDMHWSDRTSVLLLRHLVAEIDSAPVAVLVTYRDATAAPLVDVLPELVRGLAARPIELGGLSRADIAAWLPALTGAFDPTLAAALYERTDGHPLLVRLVAEDLATRDPDHAAGGIGELMSERPQLRRLVAGRVAALDAETRALVDAGSVLAERLTVELLTTMTDNQAGQVARLLERALAAGVLRDAGGAGGVQFQHALVRDAVYAELSPARRAELHRRAAEALERAGVKNSAGSIAHHWQRATAADSVERCRLWAERADDEARAVLAFDDAARFAGLAVSCARRSGVADAELARLLVRAADALYLGDCVGDSVQASTQAADLAEAADRPELMADAALVVRGVGDPDTNRRVRILCERALARLPADDHPTRARLLAQIAVGVAESEGGPHAAELASVALAEAEQSGDSVAVLEAIAARHLTISVPQTVQERLELGRRAIELSASARQPVAALWGHLWRADAALQLGNLAAVDREVVEIDRVARERASALGRWHHHRYQALRHALVGAFDLARSANEAADELAVRIGDSSMLGMTMAFETMLASVRGSIDEVRSDWADVLLHAPAMPLVRITAPLLHAVQGRIELARAEFEEFRHLPKSFPVGIRWAGTVAQIGIVAVLLEDAEVCSDVYELYAPLASYYTGDGSGAVYSHGANARYAADLARVCGRLDDAAKHYRDAIAMNARIGARPFTALSRLGLARTLLQQKADLDNAAELASTAAAEFRRLDMPGPLATAADVLAAIATARRSASPLSERENEVATLVARALSNREIAANLIVSERTVESHVRSILAKLGFSTRTEIATWAVRSAATTVPSSERMER